MIVRLLAVVAHFAPSIIHAEVLDFECKFHQACNAEKGCGSAGLELNFQLDNVSGDAFVRGNGGLSDVAAVPGSEGITFLEYLSAGGVQSTSVIFGGTAVHSRHTIIAGKLVPSQYYGGCEVHE